MSAAIETSNTNYQGELTAYGYRTQQNSYLNQATLDEMSASNASSAGYTSAAGSFLSGAGQVASKWYKPSTTDTTGVGIGWGVGGVY